MQLGKIKTTVGKLYFGSVPEEEDTLTLNKLNLYCIWNLAEELKNISYKGIDSVFVEYANIKDFSIPEDKYFFLDQLNRMTYLLKFDKSILVHCFGGHGRTGMAIACILRRLEGISSDEALKIAYDKCGGPETLEQKEFVRKLIID